MIRTVTMLATRQVCGEPGCDWRGPVEWPDDDRAYARGASHEHLRSVHGIPPNPIVGSKWVLRERALA